MRGDNLRCNRRYTSKVELNWIEQLLIIVFLFCRKLYFWWGLLSVWLPTRSLWWLWLDAHQHPGYAICFTRPATRWGLTHSFQIVAYQRTNRIFFSPVVTYFLFTIFSPLRNQKSSVGRYPAWCRCIPAPTHLIQINGSLTGLCRPWWQADGESLIWIRCVGAEKHSYLIQKDKKNFLSQACRCI